MQNINGFYLPDGDTFFQRFITKDGHCIFQEDTARECIRHINNPQEGIAIDVGAHVGIWTRHLAPHFHAVLAIEPIEEFRNCLRINMDGRNVDYSHFAISNKFHAILMERVIENSGKTHVLSSCKFTTPNAIMATPLDSLSKEYESLFEMGYPIIKFIKYDCEGYEVPAIQGAEQTIKLYKPVILVEQNNLDDTPAVALLESWGMKLIKVMNKDFLMGW